MLRPQKLLSVLLTFAIAFTAVFVGLSPASAVTPSAPSVSAVTPSASATLPQGCTERTYILWRGNCNGFKIGVYNGTDSETLKYMQQRNDEVASVTPPIFAPATAEAQVLGKSTPLGPAGMNFRFQDISTNKSVPPQRFIYIASTYNATTTVSCGAYVRVFGVPTPELGKDCAIQNPGKRSAGTVQLTNPRQTIQVIFTGK